MERLQILHLQDGTKLALFLFLLNGGGRYALKVKNTLKTREKVNVE